MQAKTSKCRNITKGRGDADKRPEINHEKINKMEQITLPVFLYGPPQYKGFCNSVEHCSPCPEDKRTIVRRLAEGKGATGLSRSTGLHMRNNTNTFKEKVQPKISGRFNAVSSLSSTSSAIFFQDGNELSTVQGRTNEETDEFIISSKVSEQIVINGIGKMKKIKSTNLLVVLTAGADAESFTFSRAWNPPWTILKLSAGTIAFMDLEYVVADSHRNV